jgi:hypothetical protein
VRAKSKVALAAGFVSLALATTQLAVPVTAAPTAAHANHSSSQKRALREGMRKLWEDHITWTRMYIVSAVADLPDSDAALNRLLANQVDIGDAIKPFYGNAAGEALTDLLTDHIAIAGEVLAAAKAGDTDAFNDAHDRWYANANDIADFLSSANRASWPRKEMRAMMKDHLDLTLAEAVARLNADWDADVAAYDQIHVQILHMADMLSRGIIAQFPNKF